MPDTRGVALRATRMKPQQGAPTLALGRLAHQCGTARVLGVWFFTGKGITVTAFAAADTKTGADPSHGSPVGDHAAGDGDRLTGGDACRVEVDVGTRGANRQVVDDDIVIAVLKSRRRCRPRLTSRTTLGNPGHGDGLRGFGKGRLLHGDGDKNSGISRRTDLQEGKGRPGVKRGDDAGHPGVFEGIGIGHTHRRMALAMARSVNVRSAACLTSQASLLVVRPARR